MKLVRAQDIDGVTMPAPFTRNIKILFAPDREDIPEIMFSVVEIPPGGHTDYHDHDRPELIYIISGTGTSICSGEEVAISGGTAMWVLPREMHEVKNTGSEALKFVTAFLPGYKADDAYRTCTERARTGKTWSEKA